MISRKTQGKEIIGSLFQPCFQIIGAWWQRIFHAEAGIFHPGHLMIGQQLDLFRGDFLQESAGRPDIFLAVIEAGDQGDRI